jgi:hypothetical protein
MNTTRSGNKSSMVSRNLKIKRVLNIDTSLKTSSNSILKVVLQIPRMILLRIKVVLRKLIIIKSTLERRVE